MGLISAKKGEFSQTRESAYQFTFYEAEKERFQKLSFSAALTHAYQTG